MNKPQWLQTGWATHSGRRPINEDAVLVDGALLAVADGVGGAPRGDLASLEAIETVREAIDQPNLDDPQTAGLVASELDEALNLADEAVKALSDRWSTLRGAATTMCSAMVFNDPAGGGQAVVANVGDSRCYHIRGDVVLRVTQDQTLGSALEKAGVDDISRRAHSILTSVLGGVGEDTPASVEMSKVDLQPDDFLLLCTDGISDVLTEPQLAAICSSYRDQPNLAASALVRVAWEVGSKDNLSAVVARTSHKVLEG